MLTQQDFEKLEKTFVTKADLKKELSNYPTKNNLKDIVSELVDLIQSFQKSMEQRFDRMESKFDMHSDFINNHEHRIDKLEDKVFSPS